MELDKFEEILLKQLNEKYHTQKELEYSKSVGTFLEPFEYNLFLDYLDKIISEGDKRLFLTPLKVFNHKFIYGVIGKDLSSLIKDYLNLIVDDFNQNRSFISDRYLLEIKKSRIYSEIEGTLNVENVPTTRKRLKEILEDNIEVEDKNDIIIKNMGRAIKFVETLPEFTPENLFKLYSLLSNDSLSEENKLKEGEYYRYDSVIVDKYEGCPAKNIEECMNSLFSYVNDVINKKDNSLETILLPHICHYYILYIHPYFDYNGRTARMISYWVYLLTGSKYYPPIISEAINETKAEYYRAIEESRNSHNDITYFLKYIFELSIDYILCYMNIDEIVKHSKNRNIVLTNTEINYIKHILIGYESKFTYLDFLKMCKIDMSKQGVFKILNKFVECGFLISVPTNSKYKLFAINDEVVTYRMHNFN